MVASAWCRADVGAWQDGSARLCLLFRDGRGRLVGRPAHAKLNSGPGAEWRQIEVQASPPTQAIQAELSLEALGRAGCVWFDDAYVGPGGTSNNMLQDFSMEQEQSSKARPWERLGLPAGWNTQVNFPCLRIFAVDREVAHTGRRSAKIRACPRPIVMGYQPVFSPKAEEIAFVGKALHGWSLGVLSIVTLGGGRERSVSRSLSVLVTNRPAWRPDGLQISCVASFPRRKTARVTTYVSELYLFDVKGNHPVKVAPNTGVGVTSLQWYPRSAGLVFGLILHPRRGAQTLSLSDEDTEPKSLGFGAICESRGPADSTAVLLGRRGISFRHPALSPDGRRLAVSQTPWTGNQDQVAWNVSAFDLGTQNLTQLTHDGVSYMPKWSPNGKKIAYTRRVVGGDLWTMNPDGSHKDMLVSGRLHPLKSEWHAWYPDSRHIAFVGHDGDVYAVSVDGGAPRRLTIMAGIQRNVSYSPEFRWAAFSRSEDVSVSTAPNKDKGHEQFVHVVPLR